MYCDQTEEAEYWIGCDSCDSWFHGTCINVTPDSESEKYFCNSCVDWISVLLNISVILVFWMLNCD